MKVLVLGIGNVMFSDEGVGVHFNEMIKRNYKFTHEINSLEFVDGGTLAIALTPIIAEFDYLIVVDCISADESSIGDVYFFDYEAMPNQISWDGSAHEVEMLQTLQLMDLAGDMPKTKILGVVPKRIEPMSFELSSEIQASVKVMEKTLLKHLEELGFSYEKISNLNIIDLANEYKNKGI
ncbi:HyaD/HybD family hydrogenase maturation endopeptidase [Campylobacter sp. RM16190]|uniref:HyaD/HybD family hydrogenase maturation endopeptidase n=1 Tax=Campylobacter sp. RM16190 TaxID=1705727 RepID=UPI001474A044|nr:HyaD/HybD family hydrogenase maturation endopeptidase [Campylobacter sp. RM16190]